MWTDAYLAAFAITSGSRLVSFDADFARFPGLHFLHLKP
jgi:predicted nucleic acid-binding protein